MTILSEKLRILESITIWSKTPKDVKGGGGHIHYFSEVVEKLLTDLDLDSNDTVLDKFVKEFFGYIRGNKQKQ